ncbi:MAG: DUF1294 domain-containing protein [Anaerolineae bacterium]|nr:DUF1294 domain-containing protein [Anaerolineae bacterium]
MSTHKRQSNLFLESTAAVVAAIVGLLLISVLRLALGWPWYWAWLVGLGTATFGLFGWDKMRAQAGQWRVPELVLLGFMVAGGCFGGALGMAVFKHKTRHTRFLVTAIIAGVAWAALGFLFA